MKLEFDCSEFFKSLDWSKAEVKSGAEKGMHDATDDLLRESRNLAPLDKGTLRKTAGKRVTVSDTGVAGEVYFSVTEEDGEPYNYALRMHEMGEPYKNPTTAGTQPKYLERPLKERADEYRKMIADAVREELSS